MRMLSIRVRNWCAPWACASGTDAHLDHMHQFLTRMLSISFPIFQMFILYTLSMRVRNWCVHWASASGTDTCTEDARQELMRTLSIRVRNWWVHWAYTSGTNACTERIPFKKCWAYAPGIDVYPKHTDQELMRMLWHVCSACALVSYAYAQHKHKNSKFERGPCKPCWAYA